MADIQADRPGGPRLCHREAGYFGDYWGRTQYFLLPALCPKRRSEEAAGLIGVLGCRFRDYPKEMFLRGGWTSGGSVGSPIRPERLHTISDRAWLAIIRNKKILEPRTLNWRQIAPDRVAESSVMHFAADLRVMARRYPHRFARLVWTFPADAHPSYVAAILDGIKATKPDEVPENERASWKPADAETVEAVFEKCRLGDDRSVASNFCRLIATRPNENWPQTTIDRLLDYAMNHPDPQEGKLNVWRAGQTDREWTVHDLMQNAMNCIRGAAGLGIGALLREHADWLPKLKPGLEHLVNDSHPAVRVAGLEASLPLLDVNKDLAVDLFLKATEDDRRIAACHYAVYYFNCCVQSHTEKLSPIIVQMFNSEIGEVAEEGAREVCARWLFHGLFEDELKSAMNGSVFHHKGIADVASHLITSTEYTDKCTQLLSCLLDDPNMDVRQKAAHAFYNKPECLALVNINPFLVRFIRSKAFCDDPTGILLTFEHYSGLLTGFADAVFAICEEFAGPLAELSRDVSTSLSHDASQIPSLLLCLYEQAEGNHPEIGAKCLDAWDILFEKRVGHTRDLTKAISL